MNEVRSRRTPFLASSMPSARRFGGAEKETFHGDGLAMIGKLFEDGIGGFETEFVLFGLVLLDEPLEEGALLGGERRALRRHDGGRAGDRKGAGIR